MSNLDQIIDYTQLFQDVELATAIGQLKQNPAQLQQFLQDQQSKIYNDVVKQKDSTFQKVYGDLNRATQVQESVLLLNKRNKELANVHQNIYVNQKKSADTVTEDKNLAERKYEMNQWSIGNKNDTLFVFSALFIALSALILITVLWRMGMISSSLWVGLGVPVIIVFVLIVVNRSEYTNVFRNKRYWNRRDFGRYGKIPVPVCPGAFSGIESGISSAESDIQSGVQSGISEAGQAVASGAQAVASGAQSVASGAQSAAGQAAAAGAQAVTTGAQAIASGSQIPIQPMS
jgi:hypothetical protein